MDAIIHRVGKVIYLLNLRIRRLLYHRIFRSNASIFLFILTFVFVVVSVGLLSFGYPILRALIYSVVLTLVLFILLLSIGAFSVAKRLQENEPNSCFHFTRSNMNGVPISNLGFIESDRDDLNLVLNNLSPKNKIDFKLVSDNRIAADYKKLLRILHLLIVGGIRDFKKEQKELLFKFMDTNFTLNGSPINRASFNSRFSELVKETEQEFQSNLEPFQKTLRK